MHYAWLVLVIVDKACSAPQTYLRLTGEQRLFSVIKAEQDGAGERTEPGCDPAPVDVLLASLSGPALTERGEVAGINT